MQMASPMPWVDSIRYPMGRWVVEFEDMGASVLSKTVAAIKASERRSYARFLDH
ncbi:hypothetical protein [Dyella subtropica]|uniref:hypothetical protein n=1 Tax=Dyella subtropica TaxID=2992127 RepID=UPI00224D4351|nr:hypothetical protein [Dyella subtropica]